MHSLTYEKKGIPIAKVCNLSGATKIISIFDENEKNNEKHNDPVTKCCKKCKGNKCKGGCCKKCCQEDDENTSTEESLSDQSEDTTSDSEYDLSDDDFDLLDTKYYKDMKMPYRVNQSRLKMKILKGKADKNIIEATKKYVKEKKTKEIIIYEGEIQPLPKYNERECIYVAGPSGSGKSTYISNYASEYKKLFPNNRIIIFSRVMYDECLDKLKPIRILINDQILEDPIKPSELTNSLVIFDDTDTIPDKILKECITKLKNDLLEVGRHENIYVAISSHLISNYRETRTVLNESHSITLFPAGGSVYGIKYILKNYGGMDQSDIAKAVKLPSRWITLKKTYPQAILYSKGVYLL